MPLLDFHLQIPPEALHHQFQRGQERREGADHGLERFVVIYEIQRVSTLEPGSPGKAHDQQREELRLPDTCVWAFLVFHESTSS